MYVSQITKEYLLIFLTKKFLYNFSYYFIISLYSFILINDKEMKILVDILITFIVSFKYENDKLVVQYLLEEKDSFKENFLQFKSIEIKILMSEIKKQELLQKFKEISENQYLIHNKINIFKM